MTDGRLTARAIPMPPLEAYPFESVVRRLADLPEPPTRHQVLEALQQDNRERLAELSSRRDPDVGAMP